MRTSVRTAAVAFFAAVAFVGTSPVTSPAVGAPAASPTVVMIIRHGEKPSGSETGYDAQGRADSHALTRRGWDRANRLVGLFAGAPRAGIARPVTIFAAAVTDQGEGLRTRETVAPLAARLGVGVDTEFGKGQGRALLGRALTSRGPVLISWQHTEIPAIAAAFPGVTPAPPRSWPSSRFDVVWTFTRTATGWHFTQLPEQVLPGDAGSVIS